MGKRKTVPAEGGSTTPTEADLAKAIKRDERLTSAEEAAFGKGLHKAVKRDSRLTPDESAAKKQALTESWADARSAHEAANPDRYKDIYDLTGTSHWRGRVSQQMLYSVMGFTDDSPHPMDQMELPGMTSVQSARKAGLLRAHPAPGVDQRDTLPDTADVNLPNVGQRERAAEYAKSQGREISDHVTWPEIHPDDRNEIESSAAATGVTMESLKMAWGSQVDQAYMRSRRVGSDRPAGGDFYSGGERPQGPINVRTKQGLAQEQEHTESMARKYGEGSAEATPVDPTGTTKSVRPNPRQEIKDEAARQGVHFQTMSDAVALGSPRMQFRDADKGDYPNVVGSGEYVRRGMAGQTPQQAKSEPVERPGVVRADGQPAKVAMLPDRGALIAQAAPLLESGTLSTEIRTGKGKPIFGGDGQEKISAFGPGFKDTHGSKAFTTSDVHTTKGGAPAVADHPKGDLEKDYLSIPGVHQMSDEALNQVLRERGLPGVHHGQATQWNEQLIHSGETTEAKSYMGDSERHPFFPLEEMRQKAAGHQFDKLF